MHDVIIIGAGFAGLGMAIALKKAGRDGFLLLEKAPDLGGTWRDNTYPGCACDIQSHMYSYSFEQNPSWTRMFPRQQEIWDYLRHCAGKYGITPHIRYGSEVREATWAGDHWELVTTSGDRHTARAVVLGIGALHVPRYPEIKGLDSFGGRAFHSARWDNGLDLTGKRIAVIGTGASAVQFVPQIAKVAARVDVYQRTPPWVIPKPDRRLTRAEQAVFRALPAVQRLYRASIFWRLESRALGFVHPRLMGVAAAVARWHMRRQVKDPALRAELTPDYTIGCKRILISNDYYPALTRPNVSLITDEIREVTPDGIVTDRLREADVIVYGTGFHVTDALDGQTITGPAGTLGEAWRDGMSAHLGISIAGFPNAFVLLGPNTGLGHNSVVYMIEQQVRYVMQALELLDRASAIEVRPEVQRRFAAEIQSRLDSAVWNTGCRSWYLDEHGVNRTIWPGFAWQYRNRVRRLDPADYVITPVGVPA
ncbi:flavin-containing monooxygenase [Longispora albida]|uniref:flavin-containing monooxygenase n=1 Tax=Longispora albida TaxID=203523 RepID=UPI000380537A|nr:NAD(P)/FAD-dependent oxidoreductase [Longispora albida]